MNFQLSKLTAFFFMLSFLFSACSKGDLFEKPIPGGNEGTPGKPADSSSFRFAVTVDVTGHPYHASNLTAVVSIVNDKNDTVLHERVLPLDLNGVVKSDLAKLPVGTYSITRFRLVYGTVNTHFATPVAGSAKASLVQKPLSIPFKVVTGTTTEVPVEVVRVQKGERPGVFGYPSGAFDNGQSDADPYMKIKLTTILQVGNVKYDSVSASLALTTWDSNGERSLSFIPLKPGVSEVPVLKSGTRFQFEVSKWGVLDKITLDPQQLDEDSVYAFRFTKEAKLLKSETTYRLVDGQYKAESKNEYVYDAAGRLSKINYFKKRENNSPYLAMTDVFEYDGRIVQNITRYDGTNKKTGVTSFRHDQQGRVYSMAQNDNGTETVARVAYTNYGFPATTIHYTYPGQNHTMDYAMIFSNGNVVDGSALISGRGHEMGKYSYDDQINPYVHMNWPNLFLSNTSKNNVTAEFKTYYGNQPAAVPYHFTYKYDADGYPTELVKLFQPYGESHYWYTTKTVYTY